jgi:hypothetical protein
MAERRVERLTIVKVTVRKETVKEPVVGQKGIAPEELSRT